MNIYKKRIGQEWRWVHIRKCANDHETHFAGLNTKFRPQLGHGAVQCSECDLLVHL
jgi:hypothetical protein